MRRSFWSPEGFAPLPSGCAGTPWVHPAAEQDHTAAFCRLWSLATLPSLPRELAIALTPGLFAEWLPQCFAAARRSFRAQGHRTLRLHVRTARSVRTQAAALRTQLRRTLGPTARFLWLAHSKGGVDALQALHDDPPLAARCVALVMVQPPIGASVVIDGWLGLQPAPARRGDALMRRIVASPWFIGGCRDCSSGRDRRVTEMLAQQVQPVPVLNVVSWSTQPTSWVDSYHARLNAARPGWAHDGQFYLPDQCLPGAPIVTLPRLDHAQPVLGGAGLDAARLWQVLALLAHDVIAHTR